jgi:hypothetical protein
MALARIITRSHACSQELALDLLARGYAVEIVSPDRIPDNLADLELRVDADPGNQLIANVKTHSGERSASIDFVHHLKAPMADFIRKPPQSAALGERFNFKAEATTGAEVFVEAPKPALKAASPAGALLPDRGVDRTERGYSRPSRDKLPPPPAPVPNHSAQGPSIVHAAPMARTKQHRRRQSSGSVSGAALTLATILLLALSLWFGMRQNGKASARISRTLPARKIATDAAKALAADSPGGSTRPSPAVFDLKSRSAGVAAASNRSRTRSGGAHKRTKHANGNYIAPDTVIYFDKRIAEEAAARAKPAKQPSKQQTPSGSDSGGAVAANAVTDFDDKGAAKTVKQDSSVKPVSPPN